MGLLSIGVSKSMFYLMQEIQQFLSVNIESAADIMMNNIFQIDTFILIAELHQFI